MFMCMCVYMCARVRVVVVLAVSVVAIADSSRDRTYDISVSFRDTFNAKRDRPTIFAPFFLSDTKIPLKVNVSHTSWEIGQPRFFPSANQTASLCVSPFSPVITIL